MKLQASPSPVSSVAISPDGWHVVAGGHGDVHSWVREQKVRLSSTAVSVPGDVPRVAFSHDGQFLVLGVELSYSEPYFYVYDMH